jgi:DNA (cytosine-5)-methyltransferase 1
MIYKTIDLCAGIGGIRRGFELTGSYENVLSAEIDPYACETYKHLFGDDPKNDLTSEDFKKIVDETEYDVLLAGFPCQSFSRIGKKLGFRDTTRGTIFFDIADIISRTNPRAIFLENVENLVSHDGGNTIKTILNTLEDELGYRVIGVTLDDEGNYTFKRSSLVRNSKHFGVPQNRQRVYLMAFSKRIYGNAIKLLSEQLPEHGTEVVYRDVNDILETDVSEKYYLSQGYLNTLKKHRDRNHASGNGFGYCVVNSKDREQPIANTILATGGSGRERNLIYQPKAGIAGKMLLGRKSPINSEGIRVMTPTEWGRLQGFIGYAFLDDRGNEHFSFPDNTTDGQKYKQFGNSVSIPVIKSMANFMLKCFDLLEHQQVEVVRALALNNPYFTKKNVMELLDLNAFQAGDLLKKMINDGEIVRISRGKTTRYTSAKYSFELPPYSCEEKVLYLAKENGVVKNKDVLELLDTTKDAVNVLLCGMVKKGLLKRITRGQYCLPEE